MEFRQAVDDCSLQDLRFHGDYFTWSNKREVPNLVRAQPDRACAIESWTRLFPTPQLDHFSRLGSDHSPIVISLSSQRSSVKSRGYTPLQFETLWLRSDKCAEIIRKTLEGSVA
ncbi:hypothetical protein Salat_0216000 [Sesamum alatum]|uniref:Endonuclease/exonuclease/phosphatase n=1 Tax=Sesamum alatum TaxID=300844 RepID=A0AAE2CYK4_9LAMI|nr:hypothetical protein Salat_0216000 [Sesamum alatum]